VKLFKINYGDEGFYNGEEVDLTNEEYSDSTRREEVEAKELRQGEPENLGTMPIIEVSTITPPVVLAALSN